MKKDDMKRYKTMKSHKMTVHNDRLRLLLVRHGESVTNLARMNSDKDAVLTDKGRLQAARIAKRLARYKIDKIIISPYIRARQTADYIIRYHKGTKIIYDDDAREHELGVFERKPQGTMEAHAIKNGVSILEYRPKGGESIEDVRKRAKRFLKKYSTEKGTLLVVAHGTFIKAMLQMILEFPDIEHRKYTQDNASLTIVKPNAKDLKLLNSTKHLESMKRLS